MYALKSESVVRTRLGLAAVYIPGDEAHEEFERVFRILDADNSEEIDWLEFKEFFQNMETSHAVAKCSNAELEKAARRAVLWALFEKMDIDGNGSVSRDEMMQALRSDETVQRRLGLGKQSGIHGTEESDAFEELFQSMDQDGNEEIGWDEFSEYFMHKLDEVEVGLEMRRTRGSSVWESTASSRRLSLGSEQSDACPGIGLKEIVNYLAGRQATLPKRLEGSIKNIRKMFTIIDTGGDGEVDIEDFHAACVLVGLEGITREDLATEITRADNRSEATLADFVTIVMDHPMSVMRRWVPKMRSFVEAFALFDEDDGGEVSSDELTTVNIPRSSQLSYVHCRRSPSYLCGVPQNMRLTK